MVRADDKDLGSSLMKHSGKVGVFLERWEFVPFWRYALYRSSHLPHADEMFDTKYSKYPGTSAVEKRGSE